MRRRLSKLGRMTASTTAPGLAARAGAAAATSDVLPNDTTLVCDDGRALAASWFEPPQGAARAVAGADAILGIAAQSGEWRRWPNPDRWLTAAFFYGLIPAVVALFGHAPAWALGGGAQPLPPEVARQWARWGRRRGFSFSDP